MAVDKHKAHNNDSSYFVSNIFKRLEIITAMFFAICISACAPKTITNPGDNWDYADLLELSPHTQVSPELDFIAAYSRLAKSDLQIRIDHLDLKFEPNLDIYIAIDTKPGGTYDLPIDGIADIAWDTLLVLPASGNPQSLIPGSSIEGIKSKESDFEFKINEDLLPRIVRIPWHDYTVVSINRSKLPEIKYGFTFQAFSTREDSPLIADEIGPVKFDSNPPGRAPILLAFWNTFPAYTPAQTLRKWDGAHTGPFGERHGLSILLNNVQQFRIPVYLLDLRNPTSLSALDYSGGMPLVKELVSDRLLILPDLIPGSPSFPIFPIGLPEWVTSYFIKYQNISTENFLLPSSQILYSPIELDWSNLNYAVVLTSIDLYDETGEDLRINPVPHAVSIDPQGTTEGLSIPIRKALIDNALSMDQGTGNTPMLILGGSLPLSAFADPLASTASLSYIASHPWIDPQNETELISSIGKISPQILPGETNQAIIEGFSPSQILSKISDPSFYSENPLYTAAWQAAISLYEPLPPEGLNLPQLRSIYTGQTGILSAAANWAENPRSRLDCLQDLDLDGIPECILASNRIFSVFDIEGARLIAVFAQSENGIHQIVGTTSQFIVGLTDPSDWNFAAGEGADIAGIHGAFVDKAPPWELYDVSVTAESLTFSSPDRQIIKRFSLTPNGLRVEYENDDALTLNMPLVIDPWKRFVPNWSSAFDGQILPNGYRWSHQDDISIEILSNATVNAHTFKASQDRFDLPEDPNYDYPQGHYLPYPLAVINFNNAGDFFAEINLLP